MLKKFFKKESVLLALILVLFLILRFHGLGFEYHQDEYKWVGLVNTPGDITDPPITALLFITTAKILGADHFRYMPLFFGLVALVLLFYFVKSRFGKRAAYFSALFFSISFYNVWASLLVDRDGEFLPTIFLLSLIFFYKWTDALEKNKKILWGFLLSLALTFGFLTRLSFILVIAALSIEFLFLNRHRLTDKNFLFKYGSLILIFFLFLGLSLVNAHSIFPYFNLGLILNYSGHFAVNGARNFLQIFIEFFKSLLYLSPLFLFSIFFIQKKSLGFLRILLIFIVLGLVFYLGLFDFSSGALDRYFVFLIVPLSIITGIAAANNLESAGDLKPNKVLIVSSALAIILFTLQFLPHYVPALYPKPEWFYRVLNFKWSFMMPFFGGSGPLGFYVSWLLIGGSWIFSAVAVILALAKKITKKSAWIFILIIGILYNGVFIEEYLFGKINGNSNYLLKKAESYIISNPNIKKLITYNDIGAYELRKAGKYQRRLYVAPKYEGSYQDVLNNFKSYYFVLDIPKIDPASIYAKYFATCKTIYEDKSGKITAKVYDCRKAVSI
jgi:hypothetical protein